MTKRFLSIQKLVFIGCSLISDFVHLKTNTEKKSQMLINDIFQLHQLLQLSSSPPSRFMRELSSSYRRAYPWMRMSPSSRCAWRHSSSRQRRWQDPSSWNQIGWCRCRPFRAFQRTSSDHCCCPTQHDEASRVSMRRSKRSDWLMSPCPADAGDSDVWPFRGLQWRFNQLNWNLADE